MRDTVGSRRGFALLLAALLVLLVTVAAGCGGDDGGDAGGNTSAAGGDTGEDGGEEKQYKVGVSNTLLGNGWREEMICSVKAEALASGKVSEVVVHNINGGAAEQIAGIRNLISSGVNAMVVNPADRSALNGVIKEAASRDIITVAVDQAVDAPEAHVVTNDQVAYGRLGMEWLAEKLGGKGNVVLLRGIEGVPADSDRQKGVEEALANYPDIKVVKEVFTGWQFAPAGKAMRDILNSGTKVDGVWTSGTDYTVVNAFRTAGKPYVPVVGADTNEFIKQLMELKEEGFEGAAVTNPATIGAAGTNVALQLLEGEEVDRETLLTPEVWTAEEDADTLESFYDESLPPTYSSTLTIEGHTHYEPEQLKKCEGP